MVGKFGSNMSKKNGHFSREAKIMFMIGVAPIILALLAFYVIIPLKELL